MLLSIVIPVFRDTPALAGLLDQLTPIPSDVEVIVAAADSDEPLRCIRSARSDVVWIEAPPGRGVQLNAGAALARGRWLWFVHADSRLPSGWQQVFEALDETLVERIDENHSSEHRCSAQLSGPFLRNGPYGNRRYIPRVPIGGSFRFALISDAWQARVLERMVAWRVRWLGMPYGDQGIFVRRTVFHQIGGFPPIPLMEDVEFVRRLTRIGPLRHQTLSLETSARRWLDEGWLRTSARNLVTLTLYLVGVSPERLARRYYRRKVAGRNQR